jgi:TrmH family RNA methyltransferase
MLITSRANERVKQVRALKDRRERDAGGVLFVEGASVVRAAFEAGAQIEQLVVAPERLHGDEMLVLEDVTRPSRERQPPPLLEVSPEVFDSLSYREERQSLGAVVRQRWESLTDDTEGARCWVLLHDIQHPGNLGTIVRCCDAIGGDGVIVTGRSTDPYHPVAVRGSLGAVFSQRIVRASYADFERWLGLKRPFVVGTSPSGDADYREVEYRAPVVLVGGNERTGLSDAQRALCDAVVRIPMAGRVESLNLSIATALVLYEVYRQLGN